MQLLSEQPHLEQRAARRRKLPSCTTVYRFLTIKKECPLVNRKEHLCLVFVEDEVWPKTNNPRFVESVDTGISVVPPRLRRCTGLAITKLLTCIPSLVGLVSLNL